MLFADGLWQALSEDLGDLPAASQIARLVIRMTLAAFLGGVLGWQREKTGKDAGLRTHMLVSIGAALFVFVPQQMNMPLNDISRVIQGLIAGIGFLGAGAILKLDDQQRIKGLTTAAGIWLTAGVGMTVGLGRQMTALLVTLLAFVILEGMHRMERWLTPATPNDKVKE